MCKFRRLSLIIFFSTLYCLGQAQDGKVVVATTSFIQDMTRHLAPEDIEVRALVPLGGDPHTYEATPSDAQLAAKADLILLNGLTLEGWITELIENSGTDADMVITTLGIDPIKSMEYENAVDPHAWMDLSNGSIYAENIAEALIKLIPQKREIILEKLRSYQERIRSLDQWIRQQIAQIPEEHRILITSHDAFQYYGRAYGLQLESVLGTSTDAEVQTKDLVRLGQVIESSKVPAIFIESTLNPKLLKQVAADHDVQIGGELYADSLGPKEGEASTYLDMLAYDTKVIVQALMGSGIAPLAGSEDQSLVQWIAYGLIAAIMLGLFFTAYIKLS